MNVIHYIVFAFIVVITLIYMADSMSSAMVMAGCLAYILIITNNMINLQNTVNLSLEKQNKNADNESNMDILDKKSSDGKQTQSPADFSDDYAEYDEYKQSYTNTYNEPRPRTAYDNSEKTHSVDALGAQMACRRFRDKRSMEGAVIRDANFYKYHFGDELAVAENRPWWGRNEY